MLKAVLSAVILIIAVILYTVYLFLKKNFNGLSWEEIVFHLKVPMKGTSNEMILDYFRTYGIRMGLGVCLSVLISVVGYMKLSPTAGTVLFVAAIILLLVAIGSILQSFDTFGCLIAQRKESGFMEEEAVQLTPEMLHFPEKKRNLIYLFLESMESTFSSKEEGGAMEKDRIPELTALAKEGVNFSGDEKIGGATPSRGASWTTGAMVSQTCAYPVMISLGGKNYQNEKNTFMPGAVSMGDVLKKEGYAQEIMVGSDLTFGGRKMYFEQHGDYFVYDYPYAKEQGKIPKDYYEWWGFEDEKLFEFAKKELEQLASEDEPFNLTMATMDTHCVEGYVCEKCGDAYDEQYYNVIACADSQLYQFVEWVKEQPWYENTTIILCGDHLTMDARYADSVDKDFNRSIFQVIVNPAVEPKKTEDRLYSALDMFPTTLAALGAEIEGEYLGLGVNLFSDQPTLCEKMGTEELAAQIKQTSRYYNNKFLFAKPKK